MRLQKRQNTNDTEVRCKFLLSKADLDYLIQEAPNEDEVKKYIINRQEVFLIRRYKDNKDE